MVAGGLTTARPGIFSAGQPAEAAQILGFDRRTLYRKLERYEELGLLDGDGVTSGP